ncbi:hypothetical protein ACFWPV_13565 [Streptomyces uncialis]|uniref:hypothetical protein n=1 Tax=Streptomyces uncialis TaxID=1048205 RepID=UPI00365FBD69
MPRTTARGALAATLTATACALLPLGALATWARLEIGDPDAYTAAMAPLATEPGVRDAFADAVTAGIMREVDRGPLQERTVRLFVRDAVGSFTGTDAYRAGWDAANRAAHDVVMRAVREQHGESVTIDLAPVTERVKERLVHDGVPFAGRIPVEPTVVTVLRGEEPERLRKGFHMLEFAGVWLPAVSVLLALGGILLATVRRRAVTATALGAAASAAVLAAGIAVCREVTLADLPPHVSRAAAGAVFDALTGSLRTAAWVILTAGVVVALTAWAAGRFEGVRGARTATGGQAPTQGPTQGPAPDPAHHPVSRPETHAVPHPDTIGGGTPMPLPWPGDLPEPAVDSDGRAHREPAGATVTDVPPSLREDSGGT